MAQRRVPAKTVRICDFCEREEPPSILTTCIVCEREYCLTCDGLVSGSMIKADICKECDGRKDVIAIMDRYAPDIRRITNRRDGLLKRLPEKLIKPDADS